VSSRTLRLAVCRKARRGGRVAGGPSAGIRPGPEGCPAIDIKRPRWGRLVHTPSGARHFTRALPSARSMDDDVMPTQARGHGSLAFTVTQGGLGPEV